MNIRARLAMSCLFAVLSAPSVLLAQDASLQSYEVELVIFRVNRPGGTGENWALVEQLATNAAALEGSSKNESASPQESLPPSADGAAATTTAAFPALSVAQYRLTGVEDGLRRSKNYQPIAHFGWTQPGYPRKVTPKFSLQEYLQGFLPDGIQLTGQASLARERLLHLTLDLEYRAPDGQLFVLRESRSMRSGEKHYFDHPYFGVITLVTPKDK